MPRFSFMGDVHVAANVFIEAETVEEAIEKVDTHGIFECDVSGHPDWFVWNGDVIFDKDGEELTFDKTKHSWGITPE